MLILRTLFTFLVLLTVSQFCKADFVVFESDFNGAKPTEISGAGSLEDVRGELSSGGYDGLGPAGNQFSGNFLHNTTVSPTATTLTLTGLPVHTTVNLEFLLAVINSWDATDQFIVRIDGNNIFSTNFQNSGNGGPQNYVPPPGVQLAYRQDFGFNPNEPNDNRFLDSAYNMGLDPAFQNIPHADNNMTIEWLPGGGWQGGSDESFAIDNVRVTINAVPEPTSSVLFALGGCLFAIRRRSNKSR